MATGAHNGELFCGQEEKEATFLQLLLSLRKAKRRPHSGVGPFAIALAPFLHCERRYLMVGCDRT
jgi:hypothetical protein